MQVVRMPLLVMMHVAVMGIASRWAAADDPYGSHWDAIGFNLAHAEDAAHSPGMGNETNEFWQSNVAADGNRPIGFDQSLPQTDRQQDPPSSVESELSAADDDDKGIVNLSGGPPPAYSFGYNRVRSATTWLPGDENRFGWFSYESLSSAQIGNWASLVTGFGIHLLDGPVQTDMPPRLFDFSIGVADRRLIQPNIGYDILFRVGAFSDFEGSARDGVRYPSHAVTFLRLNPSSELVLGIDYLDRDDFRLLPVVGTIWSLTEWLKIEAVFPRPRVAAQIINTSTWVYLGGELGGGTWAIERVNLVDDNATYKDLRLVLGWETLGPGSLGSSFEIGYVFDRKLSYSSGVGDYDPPDGFMVRMTAQY
jgi:hypothetical protein